jgi:hypothetical protein
MATSLSRNRREAELVDGAAAALDTWRNGLFQRLDDALAAHGSEQAMARDHAEYTRALQRHSFALQQLRAELSRLAADVASGVPALQERLLEVDTRLALAAWHDGGDLGANSNTTSGGSGSGSNSSSSQGYGVGIAREQSQSLHGVRAAVQAALAERNSCLADLNSVAEEMDARMAQRVWAPTTGLAAQPHQLSHQQQHLQQQQPPPPPASSPQLQKALMFSPVTTTRRSPPSSAGGQPAPPQPPPEKAASFSPHRAGDYPAPRSASNRSSASRDSSVYLAQPPPSYASPW